VFAVVYIFKKLISPVNEADAIKYELRVTDLTTRGHAVKADPSDTELQYSQ
jgi:hypothetical protein